MTTMTTTTIRMLDPVVASPVVEQSAPGRLSTLDGKVIGLYSNGKLNATKVLEMAAEIIGQRFEPARFDLHVNTISFGHEMSDEEHLPGAPDVALVAIGD